MTIDQCEESMMWLIEMFIRVGEAGSGGNMVADEPPV